MGEPSAQLHAARVLSRVRELLAEYERITSQEIIPEMQHFEIGSKVYDQLHEMLTHLHNGMGDIHDALAHAEFAVHVAEEEGRDG